MQQQIQEWLTMMMPSITCSKEEAEKFLNDIVAINGGNLEKCKQYINTMNSELLKNDGFYPEDYFPSLSNADKFTLLNILGCM